MNLLNLSVALVTESYPPSVGGVATSSRRNALLLNAAGATVQVFAFDRAVPAKKITDGEENGIRVFRFGPHKSEPDSLSAFCDFILSRHDKTPFTLIHSFFAVNAGYVATLSAKLAGIPAVLSVRGNDVDRLSFDRERLPMLLWALQRADAVTCVSTELVRKVKALVDRDNVFFVANSVDTKLFRPEERDIGLREKLGLDVVPIIGFVGEARQKKGLAVLMAAFADLVRRSDAHLLLVGGVRASDQHLVDSFRSNHESLSHRLHIIPYCDAATLVRYYNLLDILVLPSLKDGMPNALLEGMACGLPAIATPLGGMLDVVQDGQNGFLVPPGDSSTLSRAILTLLDSQSLRATVGATARMTILERFSHRQELEGNLNVYKTVLSR